MDEKQNIFDRYVMLMDQNIKGVQIGVYSVALAGLAIALRSVRPFSRFVRPSDVPNGFIVSRMKLNGIVERIEPNGALLMVQHKPLIPLPRSKVNSLPVKISGVTINGHGISWLQSIVSGNKVTFVPVLKHKDCVQCEVTMQQSTKDNKLRILNVGPALVSIGFGKVDKIENSLLTNSQYQTYYKQLKTAELMADRKRLGNWYYVKTTKELSQKMATLLFSLLKPKVKPAKIASA
ncbi:uncharacterized protein CBL_04320 [Carabus blaptoides fortunei]